MIKLLANAILVTIILCLILVSRGYSFQVDVEEDTVTSPVTNSEVQSKTGRWMPRFYEWKERVSDGIKRKRCKDGMVGSWDPTC